MAIRVRQAPAVYRRHGVDVLAFYRGLSAIKPMGLGTAGNNKTVKSLLGRGDFEVFRGLGAGSPRYMILISFGPIVEGFTRLTNW